MTRLTLARLRSYRLTTYHLKPALRVRSEADAVRFVDERGFAYFWPIKGVELPSLWAAVAGNRPVADNHDDPGHVTWGWKDKLLGERRWYYAKILRGRATMISLVALPFFYALSENYGDMENDYLLQYEAGRMTQEAKSIFEALLRKGALDTIALRREARLAGKESNTRFERALNELQMGLKILPVGVAEAGSWRYAFVYELVDRWYPLLAAKARPIGRGEARAHLLDLYLQSVGAATESQIARLFQWRPAEVRQVGEQLEQGGRAAAFPDLFGQPGPWLVTAALMPR